MAHETWRDSGSRLAHDQVSSEQINYTTQRDRRQKSGGRSRAVEVGR